MYICVYMHIYIYIYTSISIHIYPSLARSALGPHDLDQGIASGGAGGAPVGGL